MTPAILLYILDGLVDLTTVLFTHYFTIDYRPRRLKPTVLKSALPPRYTRTAYTTAAPPPPRCYASDPLPDPRGFAPLGSCY